MAIQSWRWLIQCELGAPPLPMWQCGSLPPPSLLPSPNSSTPTPPFSFWLRRHLTSCPSPLFPESTKRVQRVDGLCPEWRGLVQPYTINLQCSTVFQSSYYSFGSVSHFQHFQWKFQTGLFKHGRQVTALPETPPPVQSPRKETQESAKIVNLWTSIFNSKGWQDRLRNGTLSEFHKLKGVKNWWLVTCHRTRWFFDSLHP